jgi:hypothetical protein
MKLLCCPTFRYRGKEADREASDLHLDHGSRDWDLPRAPGLPWRALPDGWLEGVVASGTTVGGAAVLLGMWAAGIASTVGGSVGLAWLGWEMWRHRQQVRLKPNLQADDPASP